MNLDTQQKKRLIKMTRKIVFNFSLCVIYYILVVFTNFSIPCIIKKISGKYCPGCGITRMFLELLKGNVAGAAKYNIFVLVLLPFALLWGVYRLIAYVKSNKTEYSKVELTILLIVFACMIVFWIMRNMDAFLWLAPV